jgi:hypothetical protein
MLVVKSYGLETTTQPNAEWVARQLTEASVGNTRRDISFVTGIAHMAILWSGDFDQWEYEIVRPGRDHHGRTDIVRG